MADANLGRVGRGVRYMMLLVIFQRLLNFIINQLLLQHVDPAVLGLALLRCDLLLSTTLFLGREGLRLSLVRLNPGSDATPKSKRTSQVLVNLAWLTAPLGILLSLLVGFLDWWLHPNEPLAQKQVGLLYCAGGAMESLVEPLFVLAQANMLTGCRAAAEGTAALARGAATYVGLVWLQLDGALAFGVAQVVHGSVIAAIYALYFALWPQAAGLNSIKDLWPRRLEPLPQGEHTTSETASVVSEAVSEAVSVKAAEDEELPSGGWIWGPPLKLAWSFSVQSVAKHALTESDRIVLSFAATAHDQGVYVMAQNYGSLAVRVLLQPLEENARLLFSKLGSDLSAVERRTRTLIPTSRSDKAQANLDDYHAFEDTKEEEENVLIALGAALVGLLKVVSLLGLVFVTFGVQYVPVLLAVLPGKKWSSPDAVATLQLYCAYVLILGLNGSLEAFVFATANQSEVAQLTRAHVACSLLFASLCFPAMYCLGTAGIVAANCATMMARSAYSGHVVLRFFQRRKENVLQWRAVVPNLREAVVFTVATAVTAASETARSAGRYSGTTTGNGGLLRGAAVHVAVGAISFLVVAGVIFQSERRALSELMRLAQGAKAKSL